MRDEVNRFRRVAGKDHFARMFSVNEACNLGARIFVGVGRPFTERMNPPVNVGVVGPVIVIERLYHLRRFLGSGCVIQVNEWFALYFLVQYRKILPVLPHGIAYYLFFNTLQL